MRGRSGPDKAFGRSWGVSPRASVSEATSVYTELSATLFPATLISSYNIHCNSDTIPGLRPGKAALCIGEGISVVTAVLGLWSLSFPDTLTMTVLLVCCPPLAVGSALSSWLRLESFMLLRCFARNAVEGGTFKSRRMPLDKYSSF